MSRRKQQDETIPAGTVCSMCKRPDAPGLEACGLTGLSERRRRVLLCAECIEQIVGRSPINVAPDHESHPAMTETDMRRETRKQKALDRLGTDHPMCACCPMEDWRCMELHHLEGQHYGKTLVILCRNCHRVLTDDQKDHPGPLGAPATTIETIGRFLLNLANVLVFLAGKLKEFGEYLIEQARLALLREVSGGTEASS